MVIAFGTDGVLMFSHRSPMAKEADSKFEKRNYLVNSSRFRPIGDGGVAFLNHPVKPRIVDGQSSDSRQRGLGYLNLLEKRIGGRAYKLSRQLKILKRIVSILFLCWLRLSNNLMMKQLNQQNNT
uniref:Uncharacterized protein n=1 Tax=Solanum lycopersicum TaxID=4081 RepID=A0A3Q7H9B2_SOLLC